MKVQLRHITAPRMLKKSVKLMKHWIHHLSCVKKHCDLPVSRHPSLCGILKEDKTHTVLLQGHVMWWSVLMSDVLSVRWRLVSGFSLMMHQQWLRFHRPVHLWSAHSHHVSGELSRSAATVKKNKKKTKHCQHWLHVCQLVWVDHRHYVVKGELNRAVEWQRTRGTCSRVERRFLDLDMPHLKW